MLRRAFAIFRARKLHTAVTILVLGLAFCLMGMLPTLFINIDDYMLDEDTKQYGLFHGIFYEVTPEELQSLEGNMFVERLGILYSCGEYPIQGSDEMIKLGAYDSEAQELARIQLLEGRMPERSGEVALESSWRDKFEDGLEIGQSIVVQFPDGEKAFTVCGFTANYRRDWIGYDSDTPSDRLPSALLYAEEASGKAQAQHTLVCVSQFSRQENPETAFKGVASTINKNSTTYLINRNVYQNRGLNKIFGMMQRILLILPAVIAVAAAIFFAMRPQMEAYKALAGRLYARGARHRDVILLEMVWLLMMLAAAILLSQLMGEGIFALCRYLTGMPWQPFGGFGISLIAILTTVVVLMVYTRKSILPLADATYSERHTGKVLVAMEVGENFAYTFGKRRKYSNRSPAFWAGLATSLVFVLLLCGFAELEQGNYRLNVQKNQRSIEASVYTEEGKYTYRYGDFSIWEGEYFDKEQVEALTALPGAAYLKKEYGGEIACLIFPEGYSAYAQQIERVDNVPGSQEIKGIEVIPQKLNTTQRGYTVWVLDDRLQQLLQEQYPQLQVAEELKAGRCIMICPPIADSIEEGKEHRNDIFEAGDIARFAMLSYTVPAEQAAGRKDVFAYQEQTLKVARVLEEDLWLDYGYGALDTDINPGVTVIVSEQTAATLNFLNQIKGFKLYMQEDCTQAQCEAAEAQLQKLSDNLYGVESYIDRQDDQTKQIVKAVVLYAAIVALAGSVILLLCSWAHIYQRSRDLYEKTYGMLFLQGMEQKTVFWSLVWEGILYFKRTVTLMFPIMAFGETYYVSAYQYGFGELGRLILGATLLALRDILLYTVICLPLIVLAALWFGRGLRKKGITKAVRCRR